MTLAVLPLTDVDTIQAARNPFISKKKADAQTDRNPSVACPAFLHPVMLKIVMAQQALKQRMVRLARDIRQRPFGPSFLGFMLLAFLYGVVHALGPGHGKIYACAYFLNRPGTLKKGLLLSALTMIFHVFSGTALVLVGALVLKTSGAMTLENSSLALERISYALLAGVGLFLITRTVMQLRSGNVHHHGDEVPVTADGKSLVITALAVGIVPCPGAAMILLFSLTLGILPAGLAAMVCIAAGMSVTTAAFSLLTIGLKGRFLVLAEGNRLLFSITYACFALGGALCITALGSVLLTGSFMG
jgi:ABC-type nickel/cobalt efflux system permease component RcnA